MLNQAHCVAVLNHRLQAYYYVCIGVFYMLNIPCITVDTQHLTWEMFFFFAYLNFVNCHQQHINLYL